MQLDPNQGTQVPPVATPQPNPAGETMVPKYRFDEVIQRAQAAEAKVAELQKQVEGLAAKDERIKALEKELTDTKAGYELERANAKKNSAIENALRDKVVDMEVVQKLLDADKITVGEDGVLAGLDEQVKSLQESKPYLWKKAPKVVEPGQGKPLNNEKTFAQKLAEKKNAQLGVTAKAKNYF